MNVAELVTVNTRYTRSINLERDYTLQGARDHEYIVTARAIDTLSRVLKSLESPEAPNAWALIGPYGSGKSAFGLFLANLLSKNENSGAKSILQTLRRSCPDEHRAVARIMGDSNGMVPILISGSPESLTDRVTIALKDTYERLNHGKRSRKPAFIRQVEEAIAKNSSPTLTDVLKWLDGLQAYAHKSSYRGILIIIDELGKFLEHEARHRSSKDIFLLQALAEKTAARGDQKLTLITLLHQSFEQYVVFSGKQLKDEWKKVQGRFETVPFIENSEQVIAILGKTLNSSISEELSSSVQKIIVSHADLLRNHLGHSSSADDPHLASLLGKCYPLHPVSSSILPHLCQRIAQNERTLFTYLSSKEPKGFHDSLSRLELTGAKPTWIYPHDIYDYFIQNHTGVGTDQLTQRRWAEVTTAVDRLGDAPQEAIDLLKTIGVLNLVGAQSNIRASKAVLQFVFPGPKTKFQKTLQLLMSHSVITFRKFSSEYRVWQGSDIDLDSAVHEQRQQLASLNLAELLNSRAPIRPIIARRHVIECGTVRYFRIRFAETPKELESQNTEEHLFSLTHHKLLFVS